MKKFFLCYIIIFLMTGCVSEGLRQTYGDEWMEANSDWRKDDKKATDNTTTTVYNSTANVFSQTVANGKYSYAWGGTDTKPKFGIFLLSSDTAEKAASYSDPTLMPKGYPCFRIQIKGNLTFSTDLLNENEAIGVYDMHAMQYISGLAVGYKDGFASLYLNKQILKQNTESIIVYGLDMPNGKGTFAQYREMYGDVDFDKLIPCTVALTPTNELYTQVGAFSSWKIDLIMMKEAKSFPENVLTDALSPAPTFADFNYVIGSVSRWHTGDAIEANLINGIYTFKAESTGIQSFKFIIAGHGYDYEVGAADGGIKNLGNEIPLIYDSYTNNIEFNAESGLSYKITYNPQVPSCRIDVVTE